MTKSQTVRSSVNQSRYDSHKKVGTKPFQVPSYFFTPDGEGNLLNSRRQKKSYPEAQEPKSWNLASPDERFRRSVYENNIAFKEDSIVASGLAGTTKGGATFYLTADPAELSGVLQQDANYKVY